MNKLKLNKCGNYNGRQFYHAKVDDKIDIHVEVVERVSNMYVVDTIVRHNGVNITPKHITIPKIQSVVLTALKEAVNFIEKGGEK